MQPTAYHEAELDIGSDDYYFHPEKTPHWPPPRYDTVDSPFFTAGPWTDITRAVPSRALRARLAGPSPMRAAGDLETAGNLTLFHEPAPVEEFWCPGPW